MVPLSMGCLGCVVIRYGASTVERVWSDAINGDDGRVKHVDETCEHVDPWCLCRRRPLSMRQVKVTWTWSSSSQNMVRMSISCVRTRTVVRYVFVCLKGCELKWFVNMVESLVMLLNCINGLIHDYSVGDAPFNCFEGWSRGNGEDPYRTWCKCP